MPIVLDTIVTCSHHHRLIYTVRILPRLMQDRILMHITRHIVPISLDMRVVDDVPVFEDAQMS